MKVGGIGLLALVSFRSLPLAIEASSGYLMSYSCLGSAFLLVRIRAVWYCKHYMRKSRYRYKR